MHDVAVVGGGPAGLAAALWLARYRQRIVVIDSEEYRNRWAQESHGYLGSDPCPPFELLDRARQQLLAYKEAERCNDRVVEVRGEAGGFFLDLAGGGALRARRLVLAMGVHDVFPEVDGFFDHYGTSVFHCPTCDGYETQGLDVVAFGWSADVAGFALTLDGWAKTVTVVTDGRRFEGDEDDRRRLGDAGIQVIEDTAVVLEGAPGELEGVRLASGVRLGCQAAFFSIAHVQNAALADQLGCERDEEGYVVVDTQGATSVRGVYAAGDLVPGLQLVQAASAQGAVSGVACAQSLRSGAPEEWGGTGGVEPPP